MTARWEMSVVDEQLNLLERQSDPERWKRDHALAMLCCDAEDLIALALETLGRIRKRRGFIPDEALLSYFRRWHGISLKALVCIEWIEGEGYRPDRADAFRFAVNEASIAANMEQVAAAERRLAAGYGRELDEIIDGVSRQAR